MVEFSLSPVKPTDDVIILIGTYLNRYEVTVDESIKIGKLINEFKNWLLEYPDENQVMLYYSIFESNGLMIRQSKIKRIINRI